MRPPFINRYVYGRFPNAVLRRIREKNPLLFDFSRAYKNFQFLTVYADNLLRIYIQDTLSCMKESKSYEDFRGRFVKKFGLPNQTQWFEDI
jgi:hypothetical protein